MVYSCFVRWLCVLEIYSFKEYLVYVGSCKDEMEYFINVFIINFMVFFRELYYFDVFVNYLIKWF